MAYTFVNHADAEELAKGLETPKPGDRISIEVNGGQAIQVGFRECDYLGFRFRVLGFWIGLETAKAGDSISIEVDGGQAIQVGEGLVGGFGFVFGVGFGVGVGVGGNI